jgi:nitroimidazol reductase NimA-like FMN-containing flavoprotein (pyridoxamine 5'-phosphate oxidase superfamily)
MVALRGTWSAEQVESFLADARIPLRLACRTPNGGLWMLSLWFRYRDGAFECATGADADIVGYLRADDGVAFEVSTNRPPYRGVRGRGRATIDPDPDKDVLGDLIDRYLGGRESTLARRLLAPEREEVAIRIDPEKLYSWDFTERMRGATRDADGGATRDADEGAIRDADVGATGTPDDDATSPGSGSESSGSEKSGSESTSPE